MDSTRTSTFRNTDDTASTESYTTSGSFAIYPEPVDIKIAILKRKPVLRLKEAKAKEQLKAWGLRKR